MGRSLEREIVVLAAREPSASRDRALASAAAGGPNWSEVAELAHFHGVAPLLNAVVRGAPWRGAIPAEQGRQLEVLDAACALKNDALQAALESVLSSFAEAGIETVVLKGAALASTLYRAPELRPFNDLDLLCRDEHRDAAGEVLRSLGYAEVKQKPTEVDGFHTVYRKPGGGAIIELHADLLQLGLPARCGDSLWASLRTFAVGSTRGNMLGVEHMILHLCVHLHTHGYTRLIWFKDLDLLLRRADYQVDWRLVQALARSEGTALSVRHALALLSDLLQTPLPGTALRGLRRDLVGEAAHMVLWPRGQVLGLASKQRLRSLRFNRHTGMMGVLPSLVVMGRRREKLRLLLARARDMQTRGATSRSHSRRNAVVAADARAGARLEAARATEQSGETGAHVR